MAYTMFGGSKDKKKITRSSKKRPTTSFAGSAGRVTNILSNRSSGMSGAQRAEAAMKAENEARTRRRNARR